VRHTTKDGRGIDGRKPHHPRDHRWPAAGAGKHRNITERKAWEEQQKLLLGELTHRVKNTLAVVQAIAHQTQRYSKSSEDFIERLDGRLSALAAAHSLLVASDWKGARPRHIGAHAA